MRRVLLLVALAVTGLLVVPVDAAPETSPQPLTCPTLTDPAGDDRNADLGSFEDPALDILGGSLAVKRSSFVVTLRMRRLGSPTWAEGVQYAGGFTYGLKDIEIFGTVAPTNPWTRSVLALKGIRVDRSYVLGTSTHLTMRLDRSRRTVTLSMPMELMARALEVKRLSGIGQHLQLTTAGNYVVLGEPYDRATTAAPLPLEGCR